MSIVTYSEASVELRMAPICLSTELSLQLCYLPNELPCPEVPLFPHHSVSFLNIRLIQPGNGVILTPAY